MGPFEVFETDLRDALANLYDPLYQRTDSLCSVFGDAIGRDAGAVRAAIIEAIEALRPGSSVPADVPVRRYHELLYYRYVQGLTQESAAERMAISPRYLRDLQWKAVRALARHLWERTQTRAPSGGDGPEEQGEPLVEQAASASREWQAQMEQELASLRRSAPNTGADLSTTARATAELARTLALERRVELIVELAQDDIRVLIHPSALRQMLLKAITEMAQKMTCGTIRLLIGRKDGEARIRLSGRPVVQQESLDLALIGEILAAHRGSVQVGEDGDVLDLVLRLPLMSPSNRVTVLVVDDNEDLVSFYRSYTAGTVYELVHVTEGRCVFEAVEAHKPELIVLDVMLPDPDIDGWELLVHLHEHPETRSIPVIVCSVIRDEELALALGAVRYLPKPVRRRQFIEALDQVLNRAS